MNNSNERKTLKTILGIIFIVILVSIILAVVINELYKLNYGYSTIWGATDVLMYTGSIISAVCGILGVFLTVKYSMYQYREDARIRIMPFVTIDFVDNEYKSFSIGSKDEENIMPNKKFVLRFDPSKGLEQVSNISKYKGKLESNNKRSFFYNCYFTNIGNGSALKLIIYVKKHHDSKTENTPHSSPIILKKDEKSHIGLLLDITELSSNDIYDVDILYSDIADVRYIRNIQIKLEEDLNGEIVSFIIDNNIHSIYKS